MRFGEWTPLQNCLDCDITTFLMRGITNAQMLLRLMTS